MIVVVVVVTVAALAIALAGLCMLDRKDERHRAERAALLNHLAFGERLPVEPPRSDADTATTHTAADEIELVGAILTPTEGE